SARMRRRVLRFRLRSGGAQFRRNGRHLEHLLFFVAKRVIERLVVDVTPQQQIDGGRCAEEKAKSVRDDDTAYEPIGQQYQPATKCEQVRVIGARSVAIKPRQQVRLALGASAPQHRVAADRQENFGDVV